MRAVARLDSTRYSAAVAVLPMQESYIVMPGPTHRPALVAPELEGSMSLQGSAIEEGRHCYTAVVALQYLRIHLAAPAAAVAAVVGIRPAANSVLAVFVPGHAQRQRSLVVSVEEGEVPPDSALVRNRLALLRTFLGYSFLERVGSAVQLPNYSAAAVSIAAVRRPGPVLAVPIARSSSEVQTDNLNFLCTISEGESKEVHAVVWHTSIRGRRWGAHLAWRVVHPRSLHLS